jgi:8-oxo-dGTP pyrophosphatase MutT (NUDIX family)
MLEYILEYKKFKNRKNDEIVLPNGDKIWDSRSVGVTCMVISNVDGDDYILVAKRGDGAADFNGKWNAPGGYIDWDEDGSQAAIREIYEETGIYIPYITDNCEVLRYDLVQPYFTETEPSVNRQNIVLYYGIHFKCDKLLSTTDKHSEPDEISDIKWVKISDLDNYDFAFGHKDKIKYYYQQIKN